MTTSHHRRTSRRQVAQPPMEELLRRATTILEAGRQGALWDGIGVVAAVTKVITVTPVTIEGLVLMRVSVQVMCLQAVVACRYHQLRYRRTIWCSSQQSVLGHRTVMGRSGLGRRRVGSTNSILCMYILGDVLEELI